MDLSKLNPPLTKIHIHRPTNPLEGDRYLDTDGCMYVYTNGGWLYIASTTTTDEEETIEEKVEKLTLKTNLVLLRTTGIIDEVETRRLLNMMRSPDKENHVVVKEIINNKLKEI